MAEITITLEDSPAGGVKVNMTPTFETMAKMINSGNQLTSAEAYAMFAVRMVREESKRQGPTGVLIPRVGRG